MPQISLKGLPKISSHHKNTHSLEIHEVNRSLGYRHIENWLQIWARAGPQFWALNNLSLNLLVLIEEKGNVFHRDDIWIVLTYSLLRYNMYTSQS